MKNFFQTVSSKIVEMAEEAGGFVVIPQTLFRQILPGLMTQDVRAVVEKMHADEMIAGFGQRKLHGSPINELGVALTTNRRLSGFKPGMWGHRNEGMLYFVKPHTLAGEGKIGRSILPERRMLAHYVAKSSFKAIVSVIDSEQAVQAEDVAVQALIDLRAPRSIAGREWMQAPKHMSALLDTMVVDTLDAAVEEISDHHGMEAHNPLLRSSIARRLRSQMQARYGIEAL